MNFKVDDEYFKDKISYNNLEDNIYSQFAKTMAKNIDIDLAKTPLVDILTGYTRYRILQSKIDKAIEYYETHQQECVIGRNKDDKLIKDYYLPAQCSKKLYEILKGDK